MYFCASCETILSREVLPATGHTETTITVPATCTESGSVTVSCTVCGAVIGETVIPAKGHNEVSEGTPATCTEDGRLIVTCSECDYINETVIPAKGHSFGEYISNNNATCLTDGTMTALCEVCGERDTVSDEGNIETVSCSVCGEVLRQTNTETGVVYPVEIGAENFPDEVFKQYVRDNFDTDGDGELSLEECGAVTAIDVSGSESADGGMTSLKGIEIFADLHDLNCGNNSGLTELDVSANKGLTILDCRNIPITSLDVSSSAKLEQLYCSDTEITTLDLSANTALSNLYCGGCGLAYVDLSGCSMPVMFFVADDNRHLIHVVDGTFDLKSIDGFDISRIVDGTLTGATMDENGVISGITEGVEITYTYDTKGTNVDMFKSGFMLVPDENSTFAPETPEGVAINAENFPDEKFREYVTTNFDTDSNGYLSQTECNAVTKIEVGGSAVEDGGITSLSGIEFFENLDRLDCFFNNKLLEIDVRKNTALKYFNCGDTQIDQLNLSNNTMLISLDCANTPISALDLSQNTALTRLECDITKISSLDVSNNTMLEVLYCQNSQIPFVNVSNNLNMRNFDVFFNKHFITVTNGKFDLNSIDGFDISRIVDGTLTGAAMDENGVLSGITEGTNITYTYDCKGTGESAYQVEFTLVPDENSTYYKGIEINAENFPDEVFRNYVSTNFDTDTDDYLSQAECEAVTSINVSGTYSNDGGITSLKGIEHFPKLRYLYCSYNRGITELDVSKNTALNVLYCDYTKITSLDLKENTGLEAIQCYVTSLGELDVSNCTSLTSLRCSSIPITSLDVSNNTALTELSCYNTQITSLDVSNNAALKTLWCKNTQIPFVDISNCPNLTTFIADNCKYTITIDEVGFDVTVDPNFAGFDPNRVSNVVGAEFSEGSGIFYNFTADEVTYTYDCDGKGGHNATFTLVVTNAAAVVSEDETADTSAVLPPDDTNNTTPPSPADEGSPIISDEALPPENIAAMLLSAGIFTIAYLRKRKTALRYKRKAEI